MSQPFRLNVNGRFLQQPLTGVQRYARELLRAVDQLIEAGEIAPSALQVTCLTPPGVVSDENWKHIAVRASGRLPGNLWEQVDLAWGGRDGVLFSPCNTGPFLTAGQVVTLHDASVFAFPNAYSRSFRLKYQVLMRRFGKTARKIITVSQFSKIELARWCGIDPEKIEVIPHGHEHLNRVTADPSIFKRASIGEKPYLLMVGSSSPHKNAAGVFNALDLLKRTDFEVVMAGGAFPRVFNGQQVALPVNVCQVGYVSNQELRALYENARGFIFPSFYEGFGIPVLEAMAFGCPVISSNAASLPEVGGEAVLYFDPANPQEIAEKIACLVDQPDLQTELREMGSRQLEKFSWQQTARQTVNLILQQA